MTAELRRVLKRLLDVELALLGLLLAAPLLLTLALAVRRDLGSPVLFRQQRPGRHEVPFELLKFRSMRDAVDPAGRQLADAARLTPFGRWLRRSSLDELPELLNVLRGDMSLVGPRPLLMRYLPRYSARQRRRHDLRPGITGLAQVSGRNRLSWSERFELDVAYVEGWTLWTDAAILLRTIGVALGRRGVSAEGHATMPEFLGSEEET